MKEAIREFSGEYRFLSNFHLFDGSTVEHLFQASKTMNPVWKQRILDAPTPGLAKKLGRAAPLREDWNEVKIGIMLGLLRSKFSRPELKSKLLATGNAELIEGNSWSDKFWGVDTRTGVGQNWLGKLLMQVREELREAL